ncbi:transcriptional regulator [Halobiforma lacisalsi AJ5]|uniref:Transcriptional regulator n=1 Tax=Natronobacterium lacisalsi AJ5 TaxID=358396 RepID=M0LJ11_NATLA|nr:metalloregulator ArsR/SmtB family transcription factor [Halobiforma lacisalsi]APW98526.1 transcriptional regulator [Halobiforma lacisalsi AJ5]EMA33053.1 ArsR family transcriptional regulator [Halobiforma lacisalsi AJ5]
MTDATGRLERYLADELGECRDDDLEKRLDELESLDGEFAESTLERDVGVLSALANETRYRIVRLLVEADGELCVCELSPLLDVSQSAISHALSRLHEEGLVTRRKDGKWRKYEPTRRAIALVTALDGTRRRSSTRS